MITYFSDLSMNLDLDGKGLLKVNTNEQCINDMIKFIFTTFKGEVLFNPNLGNSLEEALWEFTADQIDLGVFLTKELKRLIPYIEPTINVYQDETDQRQIHYDVKYTVNNDPAIGTEYVASGTI